MHFFIDTTNLQPQTASNKFGVVSPTVYNVASKFNLGTATKAFAPVKGQIIIQQSTDAALVNVILKPMEAVKTNIAPVKYFVFRGIEKSSFIQGTDEIVLTGSELIQRFWTDYNNWLSKLTTPPPTPKVDVFGYDQNTIANTESIRSIFMNGHDVRAFVVNEGMWIGDFAAGATAGFEIILAENSYIPTLAFARATEHKVVITTQTGFEEKKKREEILNFIDPAAFYGLFYKTGVKINGTNSKIKKDQLYTDILSKFHTKNTIYLDIRNEEGYSYNFFENYNDGSGNNVEYSINGGSFTPIEYNKYWPILAINSTTTTSNNETDITIKLCTNENPEPLIYHTDIVNTPSKKYGQFIGTDAIMNVGAIWSKQLLFQAFNEQSGGSFQNIATYNRINFYRQTPYAGSSQKVPVKTEFHHNLFSIHHSELDKNYDTQNRLDIEETRFVKGQLNSGEEFSHISKQTAIWDDNHILFIGQKMVDKLKSKLELPKKAYGYLNVIKDGISSNMKFWSDFVIDDSLPDDEQLVRLFQVRSNSHQDNDLENFKFLGLAKTELSQLKQYTGLNDFSKYIYLDPILPTTGNAFFEDEYDTPYYKYTVKVKGYDNTGNLSNGNKGSLDDIEVYSLDNIGFYSKGFKYNELVLDKLQEEDSSRFRAIDASAEMKGKEFEFIMDWTSSNGTKFYIGDIVVAKEWDNESLAQKFFDETKGINIEVYKWRLKPKLNVITCQLSNNKSVKVTHYYPRVDRVGSPVEKNNLEQQAKFVERRVAMRNAKKEEIEQEGTTTDREADLKQLNNQVKEFSAKLNEMLIQQTIWNSIDNSFCYWTTYYNNKIAIPNNWDLFDPNMIKSLAFKETKIGTDGEERNLPRIDRGSRSKTRFNITQSIDSSGEILILLMREYDEEQTSVLDKIVHKYNYERCYDFMYIAQKVEKKNGNNLSNERIKKNPNDDELDAERYFVTEEDVDYIVKKMRAKFTKLNFWDKFIRAVTNWEHPLWDRSWVLARSYYSRFGSDDINKPLWENAVDYYYSENSKPPKIEPRLTYDFWVRAGVRWVFHKRSLSNTKPNWIEIEGAIAQYNIGSTSYIRIIRDRYNETKGKTFIYIDER